MMNCERQRPGGYRARNVLRCRVLHSYIHYPGVRELLSDVQALDDWQERMERPAAHVPPVHWDKLLHLWLAFVCRHRQRLVWQSPGVGDSDLVQCFDPITGADRFLAGVANQRRWVNTALNHFGINTVDPVPTAWDWVFGTKEREWVIVTLNTGKILYGVYRFASSDPAERDIFLEETWTVEDNGEWKLVDRSGGVLIRGNTIVTVEFLVREDS